MTRDIMPQVLAADVSLSMCRIVMRLKLKALPK